jgi:hypothetical protein
MAPLGLVHPELGQDVARVLADQRRRHVCLLVAGDVDGIADELQPVTQGVLDLDHHVPVEHLGVGQGFVEPVDPGIRQVSLPQFRLPLGAGERRERLAGYLGQFVAVLGAGQGRGEPGVVAQVLAVQRPA